MESFKEIFKKIPNYSNYSISNTGIVRNDKRGKNLQYNILKNGYARVDLCNTFGTKHFSVHRLVADLFIENIENKSCVNHIDGNKVNNRVNNLEWCTERENTLHAINTGLFPIAEDHPNSKLTNEEVRIIPLMFMLGGSRRSIAESLKVDKATISNILAKKTYASLNINIDMKNTYLPRGTKGKLFTNTEVKYLIDNTELITKIKELVTV